MNQIGKIDFLKYALIQDIKGEIDILSAGESVINSARQNDKRDARLELQVPDDWVKNLKGDSKMQDVFVFMKIPREFHERYISPVEIPKIIIP